jgi:hypothetical protein
MDWAETFDRFVALWAGAGDVNVEAWEDGVHGRNELSHRNVGDAGGECVRVKFVKGDLCECTGRG